METPEKVGIYGSGISASLLALILLQHRYNLFLYEPFLEFDFARPLPPLEDQAFQNLLHHLPLWARKTLEFQPFPGAFREGRERHALCDEDQREAVVWEKGEISLLTPDPAYRYSEPLPSYPEFLEALRRAILLFGERIVPLHDPPRFSLFLGIFPRFEGLPSSLSRWIILIPQTPGTWVVPPSLPDYLPYYNLSRNGGYWCSRDRRSLYYEGEAPAARPGMTQDGAASGNPLCEEGNPSSPFALLHIAPSCKPFLSRRFFVYPLPSPLEPPSRWAVAMEELLKRLFRWLPARTRVPLIAESLTSRA